MKQPFHVVDAKPTLPVEINVVPGSVAIAIEAHAVQLALQGGLGFTLPVRTVRLPRKHQAHCLHQPDSMSFPPT